MEKAITTYSEPALQVFGNERYMQSAQMLAQSDIIPIAFKGKPANVLIALDMAQRLKSSPMLVMQNLNVIQGKPSWSSQFLIAMVNSSGRFSSPLQYDFERDSKGAATACTAYAVLKATGERVSGPKVTMEMAKAEGWLGKSGSKWQTMPELMLTYRAAAFFARTVCPDLAMGLYTEYEQQDIVAAEPMQYEDKTAQPDPAPEPVAEAPKKQPIPKARLFAYAVDRFGKKEAVDACKAAMADLDVVSVTEDNLGALCDRVEAMYEAEHIKAEPAEEPVPEYLAEDPLA